MSHGPRGPLLLIRMLSAVNGYFLEARTSRSSEQFFLKWVARCILVIQRCLWALHHGKFLFFSSVGILVSPGEGEGTARVQFQEGRSCAWSLCCCCGDHWSLWRANNQISREPLLTGRSLNLRDPCGWIPFTSSPRSPSFFLPSRRHRNKSLMVQRVFEINLTVGSSAKCLLPRARDDTNSWACLLIQGNTLRLLGGSSTLSVAQGCICSCCCVRGVCVHLCTTLCSWEMKLFIWFFFQILTVSTDQRCSQRH